MKYITSKTHRYISIRRYPSDYILKNSSDRKRTLAIHKMARKYHKFHKKFIEFATGKDYSYYEDKYFLGHIECSKEELHELTGIKIAESGNCDQYCIPRDPKSDKLYNYLLENLEGSSFKFKVLKKTTGTYMDHGPSNLHRGLSSNTNPFK